MKITITIEFYIQFNPGSKFQLQETILIFETNFEKKKDTSGRKQKKQTSPMNSSYLYSSKYQFST